MASTVYVGSVHAAVGADKTMPSLSDEHAILTPDHAAAFAHGQLNHAGIESIFFRPGDGCSRRLDRCQIDNAAFRLGNHLVLDDENVAGFECGMVLGH